jgi:FdhE protein
VAVEVLLGLSPHRIEAMDSEEIIPGDLYRQLERVKIEARKKYRDEKMLIDESELERRIAQSRPLIDLNNIEMDGEWLEGLFKKYLLVLKKSNEENTKLVEKLELALEQGRLDPRVLAKKVFCSDSGFLGSLARKLKVRIDDLSFLGLWLANPVLELYATKLKKRIDSANWLKGSCPVCGSPPAMAYLRKDDGKRILWCRFCSTKWSFLRLKCPFCSNEDQQTLRYFFAGENDPRRVYVCDKCKKYLKTIDERKRKEEEDLDLKWENLATLELDFMAQKEGYSIPVTSEV